MIGRHLREDQDNAVLKQWQHHDYQTLRCHAAWLSQPGDMSQSSNRPRYIDPVDYLMWAVRTETYPRMVMGPAHGDLHGRNVIVGTVRGEAEWPAVFDFDQMSDNNLVAWDFAKLEIELKCRLFQELIDSEEERAWLRHELKIPLKSPLSSTITLSADDYRAQQQAELMEIMLAIESVLDDWTRQISSSSRALKSDAVFAPAISPSSPLGRGLRIIFRIRKEAAIYLGFERRREKAWRDEYTFALLMYGVVSVKWHSADDHLAWALISSGVAAASLSQFAWPPSSHAQPLLADCPSYLNLLPYAQHCWKESRSADALELLRDGLLRFPYAVALRQQLALSLIASNSEEHIEIARREIEGIARQACVFRDHESLCRLGTHLQGSWRPPA